MWTASSCSGRAAADSTWTRVQAELYDIYYEARTGQAHAPVVLIFVNQDASNRAAVCSITWKRRAPGLATGCCTGCCNCLALHLN